MDNVCLLMHVLHLCAMFSNWHFFSQNNKQLYYCTDQKYLIEHCPQTELAIHESILSAPTRSASLSSTGGTFSFFPSGNRISEQTILCMDDVHELGMEMKMKTLAN